ncbi:MAG TPA: 4'-phosphopantetheinyl transferase superfamily protein [Steroidobacteraceae bacterium]|nr:4'-phosphopantetheinyl transferase superfamily protein [Steroidobacteraceae bacterium]
MNSESRSTIETNPAKSSTSLRGLFPPGALVAELRGPGDPAALLPEETLCVKGAVQKRVQEFAAGRACAHRLLGELGIDDFSIKVADDRRPLWPDALVGSITHTSDFCAVVVAKKETLGAVGIDSEIAGSVEAHLWRGICTPSETAWLRSLPEDEQTAAATLIFSAKEAFYKCQYPLVRERLSFHDATVEPVWGAERGVFKIHATRSIALARHAALPLQGEYLFHEEFVSTGIALPRLRHVPDFE